MAKVSIIIPTFNVEPFLVECMESITRQTLEDIEIIAINDGSTDGSLAILQEYAAKDSRITIVDKVNEGYGIGMNIGLEKATGEYIGILEPDDFVKLNMFGDLYDIAKANDLDWVKADFYRFTRDPDESMYLAYNHLSKNPEDYNKVFDPSKTPQAIRWIMNTWSGIYKRSFLEEHGIRHNTTPGASFQDNGFWFQTFAYAKRGMIVDKPFYLNRRDNPNSSVKNVQKVYCMNVEYDHIRDLLMRDEEVWNTFKYIYWVKKLHNYTFTLGRISDEFKHDYVMRMSEEFKRAMVKNELDSSEFTEFEWKKIGVLTTNPEEYYKAYALNEKIATGGNMDLAETRKALKKCREDLADANRKLATIKNSPTFKIGHAILFIPGLFKKAINKIRHRG